MNLDPVIFPYQDIRYTGKNTGAKPKIRKDVKLAPNFLKPKVPMPGSVVVPKPNEADRNVVEPTNEIAPCVNLWMVIVFVLRLMLVTLRGVW